MAIVAGIRPSTPGLIFIISIFFFSQSWALSETEALLQLKESFANAGALSSWTPNSSACSEDGGWDGVICFSGVITGLRLGSMGLSGNIDMDALLNFKGLRSLSLVNNNFSGPIPEFNRLGALKSLYLTGNQFSGEIPDGFFSKMESLKKVWLAHNAFTGSIPSSLGNLSHLIELHLEHNQFSGAIPNFLHAGLKDFNASDNPRLEGEIPKGLASFGKNSFIGNPGLCGGKLEKKCAASATRVGQQNENGQSKTIGIILVLLLCAMTAVVVIWRRRNYQEFDTLGRDIGEDVVEVCVSSHNNRKGSTHAGRRGSESSHRKESHAAKKTAIGDLVVVNESKGVFGLPDLMKAAAEVLGNNGAMGSSYKAVMSNGVAVVVKRMREMNRVGQDGFEAEMRRLGQLRHPNIITPLAFHYRKEEKLLVYEFVPGGSLLYLLHGNRGPCQVELGWAARLKIIRGIAQGLAYLHTELSGTEIPHGNLKSSNVLLAADLNPLLADFGYSSLVTPTNAANSMFAYKSPESVQYRHVSPKSDVYCFGIVVLEIVTGKYPSQYNNGGKGGTDLVEWVVSAASEKREAELFDPELAPVSDGASIAMQSLLHLGSDCAEPNPERRPDMKEAARRVEEIAQTAREQGDDGTKRSHAETVRALSSRRRESLTDRGGSLSWSDSDSGGFAMS